MAGTKVKGKDIRGNTVILKRTQPSQLILFQTFLPDDDKYSNSIELYDALPKYYPAKHVADMRIQGQFLPHLEREFAHRGDAFKLTIIPARLIHKDGAAMEFYPTFREELVEEALRKIASDRRGGVFLNEQAGVEFSLYELQKELRQKGHTTNAPDPIKALKICNLTSLILERGDAVIIQAPIFPVLLLSARRDWEDNPLETKCYVQFHPLVTASVTALTFRQFDYQLVMSYTHRLTRWLHKRLAHNYIQASLVDPYRINLSTILRDSGTHLAPRKDNRPREVETALDELQHKQVLMEYSKTVQRGNRNSIMDISYVLRPDLSFIQEVKLANARAKRNQESKI